MRERQAKPYLSTFHDYLTYIQQQMSDGEVRTEYLFNILRDIGYLTMIGAEFPVEPVEEIRSILASEGPFAGKSAPDLIDFEDLTYAMDSYIRQSDTLPAPPLLGDLTGEETWEDMWREVRGKGIELISAGMDMTAILLGHTVVLKKDTGSADWNAFWSVFEDESGQYLTTLSDNKERFYHLSDEAFSFRAEFGRMPECAFRDMLLDIAAPRETYVKEHNYRRIISPEKAKEIYFTTNMKFEQYSPTARFHFYEHALAQEILKAFVSRICLAKEKNLEADPGNWQLLTTLDEGFDCEIPMLSAGEAGYSVHMLHTPSSKTTGWGIRKDRMEPFLSDGCEEFQGALFCSWKIYPTDEVLVRFDNYMKRDRLKELLNQKQPFFKENFFKDYMMLTLDDVYKYPLRDEFLEEAATAAMGLPVEVKGRVPALSADEREKLEERLLAAHTISLTVVMGIAAVWSCLRARRSAFAMGATSPPPESSVIFVPRTFPAEGVENAEFFDPWSGVTDLSLLIDLASREEWFSITFFSRLDRELKLATREDPEFKTRAEFYQVFQSEEPEQFKRGEKILRDVPAGTTVTGFIVGPKDKVTEARNSFDQHGKMPDVPGVYWVIYGPGETEEKD